MMRAKPLKLGASALALATLIAVMPVSVQRPGTGTGKLSIGPDTAVAADLSIAPRHRRVVIRQRYAVLYNAFCGGPYVGGGWNGGTYWGGPWIDLSCYGMPY